METRTSASQRIIRLFVAVAKVLSMTRSPDARKKMERPSSKGFLIIFHRAHECQEVNIKSDVIGVGEHKGGCE